MTLAGARIGFGLAAAAQAAYMPLQENAAQLALTVLAIVALATAALVPQRGAILLGALCVAAAAALGDLALALARGFDIWVAPQTMYAVGLLMAAAASRPDGHDFGVRAGAGTAAFGSALWILLDPFNAVGPWLAGNALDVAGLTIVALAFRSDAASREGSEAPG